MSPKKKATKIKFNDITPLTILETTTPPSPPAKVEGKPWTTYAGIQVRKGVIQGRFEILITKDDGTLVKLIGMKVDRFWSEPQPKSLDTKEVL